MSKSLSSKYGQNLDNTIIDSLKTALKRAIQKTAEATRNLVEKKIDMTA